MIKDKRAEKDFPKKTTNIFIFKTSFDLLQNSIMLFFFFVNSQPHWNILTIFKKYLFLCIYFTVPGLSCGAHNIIFSCYMWDLVPQLVIEPRSCALGVWSLYH